MTILNFLLSLECPPNVVVVVIRDVEWCEQRKEQHATTRWEEENGFIQKSKVYEPNGAKCDW